MNRLQYWILLLSLSLLWSCKHGTGSSDHPQSRILSHIDSDFCRDCRDFESVIEFEQKKGDQKLNIQRHEISVAFLGNYHNPYIPETIYKSAHSWEGSIFEDYDSIGVWIRKSVHDSLPHFALCYIVNKEDPKFNRLSDPYTYINFIGKFFFHDPILDKYVPDSTTSFDAFSDTTFVWDLYDTLEKNMKRYFPVDRYFHMKEAGIKDKFMFDVNGSGEARFRFRDRPLPNGGTYPIQGAPFEDRYQCMRFDKKDDFSGKEFFKGPETAWVCLGWAGTDAHYERLDSAQGKKQMIYDIQAHDLAVYLSYSYHFITD